MTKKIKEDIQSIQQEDKNKTILLSEIIKKIDDGIAILADFDNEKYFNKICGDLIFTNYLPLAIKRSYLSVFMMKISMLEIDLEEASNFAIDLEKASLLYLLLQPYTNIEIDIVDFSDEDYDTLVRSGFIGKIMQFCGNDYYKMQDLLNETYRVENIIKKYESSQELDLNKMEELMESLKTLFSNLTPEEIQNLNSIITANDPIYGALREYVVTDNIK